jgi:hypothetical protein
VGPRFQPLSGAQRAAVGVPLGGSSLYELRIGPVSLPVPLAKPVRGDRVEAMSTTHILPRGRRLRMYGGRGVVDAPFVSAVLEREPADVL